jgi:hypothetical protein
MKKKLMLTAMAIIAIAAVTVNAATNPVVWKQSNSYSGQRIADNLSNAAGMDVTETIFYNLDGSIGGEPVGGNDVEWVTSSNGDEAAACTAGKIWIIVDLGDSNYLGTINIWNFQWNHPTVGDLSNRGVSQFDIYVRDSEADTDDGTASGTAINLDNPNDNNGVDDDAVFDLGVSNQWQLALENQSLDQAPNTDTYTGQSFDLTGKNGRFVAIVVDTYYGGSGVGLGKVRIDADPMGLSPKDGATVDAGDVELSWTNIVPTEPNDVYVTVLFGDPCVPANWNELDTDPASGLDVNSVTVLNLTEGTYYWQVISDIGGPNTIKSPIYSFTASIDLPPASVEVGNDKITWTGEVVPLFAEVFGDDGESTLTYSWTADAISIADPNLVIEITPDADPAFATVDIAKVFDTGGAVTVTITVVVNDAGNPETFVTDTMTIDVYDNACQAARIGKGEDTKNPTDIIVDCITDISDLAEIAAAWLKDTSAKAPVTK